MLNMHNFGNIILEKWRFVTKFVGVKKFSEYYSNFCFHQTLFWFIQFLSASGEQKIYSNKVTFFPKLWSESTASNNFINTSTESNKMLKGEKL